MDKADKEPHESDSQLEELRQALNEEKNRSEEYLTRLKYMQADFENLKKRLDREVEEAKKYCNERLLIELLDIVDELEMAVSSGRLSDSKETIIQGVEMTLKKLKKTLEKEGVSPIDCMGKPFDPSKHAAVSKVERDDAEGCTVIEEIRRGYNMKEKVIRPSVVKVAVEPSPKPQKEIDPNE